MASRLELERVSGNFPVAVIIRSRSEKLFATPDNRIQASERLRVVFDTIEWRRLNFSGFLNILATENCAWTKPVLSGKF
jgi:hypothetical protein